MATSAKHGLARYNAGCRCDLCRSAMSDYRKNRRRTIAESVGDPAVPAGAGLRVINNTSPTSTNVVTMPTASNPSLRNKVVETIQAQIDAIEHKRPDLAVIALALAEVLDNDKAVATKPAAAAKLAEVMDQLRKSAGAKKSKLAVVRAMTSANSVTG